MAKVFSLRHRFRHLQASSQIFRNPPLSIQVLPRRTQMQASHHSLPFRNAFPYQEQTLPAPQPCISVRSVSSFPPAHRMQYPSFQAGQKSPSGGNRRISCRMPPQPRRPKYLLPCHISNVYPVQMQAAEGLFFL